MRKENEMNTTSFFILNDKGEREEVSGVTFPEYGLGYDLRIEDGKTKGYPVTHLATGFLLLQPYEKEEQAVMAIELIGPLYDWKTLVPKKTLATQVLPPVLQVVLGRMHQIDRLIRFSEEGE